MKTLTFIDRLPAGLQEDVHEELARGGLWTAYSLGRPGGMKTIDSPYEPRGETTRTLIRAGAVEGTPVLLLGAGSGYFARQIVEQHMTPALLLTRSRALANANRKRLEKQLPDAGEDVTLVADDNPERAWRENVQPFLEAHPGAIIVLHPRERRAFPGFYGPLELRLEAWKRDRAARPDGSPRPINRVLWVGAGGLFERELIGELTRRGIDVTRLDEAALQRLTPPRALDLLDEHRPDLVLSTNNRGSDEAGLLPAACDLAGVHWATWLLDEPRYLLRPDELDGAGPSGRMAFCWDRNGLDGWRDLGFSRAELLPLATDPALFSPADGIDELTGRLVFVGSPRFARAEGFFAALDGHPVAIKAARLLEPHIRNTRRPPSAERVDEVLRSLGDEAGFDPEARRRLPAFAVQQANLAYRVELLNTLAPLRPIVFGKGWEGRLDERVDLRPPLDYYDDLPAVYRSDAVHLSATNLQMRSHPNQRPFDLGACGRMVLMDDLDALPDLFGKDLAGQLSYATPADLLDMATALASDPQRRRELGRRLRDVVLERHTLAHRVDQMLAAFCKCSQLSD